MNLITITSATATAPTQLSAFDAALYKAGLGDANLLHLSSIIPLGCEVEIKKKNYNDRYQGDRIYVVYAEKRLSKRGTSVAAGLGWVQTTSEPKWGLFVEHAGYTEEEVEKHIKSSLKSMMSYRTKHTWGGIKTHITSIECKDTPVCALAVAVYKREDW